MKTHGLMFLVTVGFLCGADPIFAAEENSEQHWTGVADLRSRYVGGMTGARIADESVVQPSITLSHENCYVNVWASLHTADTSRVRKGDEVDLSGGCTWGWGTVMHTVSILYYDLYPLRSARGDLFALRDTMTFPMVAGFTPTLAVETDIPQDRQQLPGGVVYKMEFSREMLAGGNRVIGSVALGGHDGAYGLEPERISFVRGTISFPLRIGSADVSPSIMLQRGGRRGGLAKNEVVIGVNVSW